MPSTSTEARAFSLATLRAFNLRSWIIWYTGELGVELKSPTMHMRSYVDVMQLSWRSAHATWWSGRVGGCVKNVWRMYGEYSECVAYVCGKCVAYVLRVCGECVANVWQMCGEYSKCVANVWRVCGKFKVNIWKMYCKFISIVWKMC